MEDTENILLALGRLEGKVESLINMQRSHDENLESLEQRVRILEQGKAYIYGGAAVIGSLVAALMSWIIKVI
jgi:hypothetical protein